MADSSRSWMEGLLKGSWLPRPWWSTTKGIWGTLDCSAEGALLWLRTMLGRGVGVGWCGDNADSDLCDSSDVTGPSVAKDIISNLLSVLVGVRLATDEFMAIGGVSQERSEGCCLSGLYGCCVIQGAIVNGEECCVSCVSMVWIDRTRLWKRLLLLAWSFLADWVVDIVAMANTTEEIPPYI